MSVKTSSRLIAALPILALASTAFPAFAGVPIPRAEAAQDIAVSDPFVRYPDICGTRLVFSQGGDLWLQDMPGAIARRLTSSPGTEYFAKFSPDCTMLAFTGQIDGDDQVYVMPATGGEARRLTSVPAWRGLSTRWGNDNQVTGWTPDGSAVLFRSMRDAAMLSQSNLYTVDIVSKAVAPAGMARAGAGVFSPDGRQIVYSPWSRDFRTWKHYRGGWAQDLWIFDRTTASARPLTRTTATERDAMWTRQGLFYLSDRNGAMNLFRQDAADGPATQISHEDRDAMWASADRDGHIVYEVDGRLWTYDASTGASPTARPIRLPSDAVQARPRYASFDGQIDSFTPTPDGKAAVFVARGDVFAVATNDGPVRALTITSNAQEREAAVSPDGKTVAYVSDATGEEEIWTVPIDGGVARQLTRGHRNRFAHLVWSPDGQKLALSGKDGAIFVITIQSGEMREIGRSGSVFVADYTWAPGSRYLAYSHFANTDSGQIMVHDLTGGQTFPASDARFNATQPAFSPDGNYIYYLTQREFTPRYDGPEWDIQVPSQRAIVQVALRAGLPNPFLPDATAPAPAVQAAIDSNRLPERLVRVPLPSGNIAEFTVNAQDIVLATADADPGSKGFHLWAWSFAGKERRSLAERIDGYSMTPGAMTVLVRDGGTYALLDTKSGKRLSLPAKRLGGMINPREEWGAILEEVYRRYRDFFYTETMQGFDWAAIRDRYRAQLPRLSSRSDLTELIGRMVSELNVGHAYIDGRDELKADTPGWGALGATFAFDVQRGKWKIAHIYAGDPVDPAYRSPLAETGVDAREGDWVEAIDGRLLDKQTDPYTALAGKADVAVSLTLRRGDGAPRNITVTSIATQDALVYHEWSEANRALVDRLSGGRIGYIHVPAMSPQGLAEFMRGYLSQIRKDGLILDIRGNLGGSGSPLIIERLARPFLTTGHVKGMDYPVTYPWGGFTQVFTGQRALLVNEATMSDGDTMAYEWRQARLGPIFGMRTWGGTVGTGSNGPLLDGSETHVPQYALADTRGRWVVEGEGVSPDVEIPFDAQARLGGGDPQLSATVAQLLTQIDGHPGTLPAATPAADKTAGTDRTGASLPASP